MHWKSESARIDHAEPREALARPRGGLAEPRGASRGLARPRGASQGLAAPRAASRGLTGPRGASRRLTRPREALARPRGASQRFARCREASQGLARPCGASLRLAAAQRRRSSGPCASLARFGAAPRSTQGVHLEPGRSPESTRGPAHTAERHAGAPAAPRPGQPEPQLGPEEGPKRPTFARISQNGSPASLPEANNAPRRPIP